MQCFVLIRIVGFLKYRHIIGTAFMKITVFVCVDRIYLQSDHAEIFPCQPACLANIFDITLSTALAGQNQNFFHSGVSDHLHFLFDLLH